MQALAYWEPRNTQNPVKDVWWNAFCRTLWNTSVFKTWGMFRIMSNIYYGEFYLEPCVTLSCLELWHIQNTVKYFTQNLVEPWHVQNPHIFATLINSKIKACSEPCQISISVTIAGLDARYIQNLVHSEPQCVS